VIAHAGSPQAALVLEVAQHLLGRRAEKTRLGTDGREPGGTEAAL
jgi:hypothetical protein